MGSGRVKQHDEYDTLSTAHDKHHAGLMLVISEAHNSICIRGKTSENYLQEKTTHKVLWVHSGWSNKQFPQELGRASQKQ